MHMPILIYIYIYIAQEYVKIDKLYTVHTLASCEIYIIQASTRCKTLGDIIWAI